MNDYGMRIGGTSVGVPLPVIKIKVNPRKIMNKIVFSHDSDIANRFTSNQSI